jgi:hypothetical protein
MDRLSCRRTPLASMQAAQRFINFILAAQVIAK